MPPGSRTVDYGAHGSGAPPADTFLARTWSNDRQAPSLGLEEAGAVFEGTPSGRAAACRAAAQWLRLLRSSAGVRPSLARMTRVRCACSAKPYALATALTGSLPWFSSSWARASRRSTM